MAFDRLQQLGEERFTKIINHLIRGGTCKALARMIQQPPPEGWGEYQGVAESTLIMQLSRLRIASAEGMFGAAKAKQVLATGKPNINKLDHISVPVLARMEELSEAQRTMALVLIAKATQDERSSMATNEAVDNYRKILLDIQKIRFDLGLDDFKGPAGGVLRGVSQTTTFPDGMSVQKQIFEAVTTLEQIFDARKIPQVIQGRE